MSKEKILKEYDAQLRTLNNLSHSVKSLIDTLLTSENINAHTVSSRVKEKESLSKKIDKKDKYIELNEVTDIVGIRIVTHYSDDVDKIATLLEKEFNIDDENSIDKRKMLDPDRFGYLSLHYVLEFNKERLILAEYKQFKGMKFEIQIRSILQHTWAEIEHDIGYKSKAEVPRDIRRQFSRLAGLLEIADNEFVNIKNSLEKYEKYVGDTILKSPENISIDAVSLHKFIISSEIVKNLDSKLAEVLNLELTNTNQEYSTKLVKNIEYFGMTTIYELSEAIKANENKIIKAVELIYSKTKPSKIKLKNGISLRFISYVLAAETLTEKGYEDFIEVMKLPSDFTNYLKDLKKEIK